MFNLRADFTSTLPAALIIGVHSLRNATGANYARLRLIQLLLNIRRMIHHKLTIF